MTDPKTYIAPAEEKMEMAVAYLDETLARIRAGKANPKILDGVRVDYYGSMVPVSNVANVAVPDARTITITPWEKSMFKVIEKAIINSEVGITPENNGEVIRLSIPPLTEDRRKALVKQCKAEAENAKVSVRNARRDAIDGLKKAVKQGMPEDVEKDAEGNVQKIHDKYLKRIDDIFAAKEKEILTV
ncbi:MAG: ribosome recycling factor [Muribaculaceae bacterium]|nr:ribosome recycling factor [Muribaculaceae bacterium]